jgi:hypothetical protein
MEEIKFYDPIIEYLKKESNILFNCDCNRSYCYHYNKCNCIYNTTYYSCDTICPIIKCKYQKKIYNYFLKLFKYSNCTEIILSFLTKEEIIKYVPTDYIIKLNNKFINTISKKFIKKEDLQNELDGLKLTTSTKIRKIKKRKEYINKLLTNITFRDTVYLRLLNEYYIYFKYYEEICNIKNTLTFTKLKPQPLTRTHAIYPLRESFNESDTRYMGEHFISYSLFENIKEELLNIDTNNVFNNINYIIDYFLLKWDDNSYQPSIYNRNFNYFVGNRPFRYCWCLINKISSDIIAYQNKLRHETNIEYENKLQELYDINDIISGYRTDIVYSSAPDNIKENVKKYIEEHNNTNNPKKELFGLFKLCKCDNIDVDHVNKYHYSHHYDCEHGRIYL